MPRTEAANREIRAQRQAQIQSAAARLFAHNGFVGTRIEDIADAVSMSKGLLYHYFGSKTELYIGLVEYASSGTVQLFEEAMHRHSTATERLRWLVMQIMDGLTEQPDMFMVILQARVSDFVPIKARERAVRLARQVQDLLEALIREGQEVGEVVSGDPKQLAWLLGSCIQGIGVGHAMAGAVPPITDELIRLFTEKRGGPGS